MCRSAYWPRFFLAAAFFYALAAPAFAQHDEVQALATRMAGELSKTNATRIAVAEFVGPGEGYSALGRMLSLEFTASLAWTGKGLIPFHSLALPAALREVGSAPKNSDIFDDRVVKRLGGISNAEVVVTGVLGIASDHIELSVRAAKSSTGETVAQFTGNIPLTPAMQQLLVLRLTPLAFSGPAGAAGPPSQRLPDFHDGAYESGRNGVTFAKCVSCPNPSYNDKARAAKINGNVILRLIIREDGTAANVTVQRGLGYGLDEEAVRTVSAWRFTPATNAAGKPVPVWSTIEVTFRIM